MKLTGFGEQYDGGRDIYVLQEGAHVMLSVEAESGANAGTALITSGQARAMSTVLLEVAQQADAYALAEASS